MTRQCPLIRTRRRTIRAWQCTMVTVRVSAGTWIRCLCPPTVTVSQRAGMRTRSRFLEHRSALTTRANETVLTVGSRIVICHV